MASYEKPAIIVNNELSEGIYAASGAVSDSSADQTTGSSASYTLEQTGAWDGNKNYNITLTNNSDKHVKELSVTVTVNGTVNSIGGNVSGTVNGTSAVITCDNYKQGFGANASGTFYMSVSGSGDFSLK